MTKTVKSTITYRETIPANNNSGMEEVVAEVVLKHDHKPLAHISVGTQELTIGIVEAYKLEKALKSVLDEVSADLKKPLFELRRESE